jgi:[ribosomal protein S5]-alanine N-acetyltransferase
LREPPGVTLELQTAAHAEEMFALLSDPKIYRYENEPPPSLEWLRERFTKLESRRSPDGREQWLNWVIRLETGEAAGYVQATVHDDGHAAIAYVLGSRFWDRGIGRHAVSQLIPLLEREYGVRRITAILKRANERSRLLLERLGFSEASFPVEADELAMERSGSGTELPRR